MHRMIRIKQTWCGSHGDGKVGAQLIVLVLFSRLVQILVDTSTVDDRGVDVVLGIVLWRDRDIVTALEVGLEQAGPVSQRDRATTRFVHAGIGVFALLVESSKPIQSTVQHASNLDSSTITGSSRDTLGACPLTLAHLVHPCATVELVAAKDDTVVPVNLDLLVEAFILHLGINLGAGIRFPDVKTFRGESGIILNTLEEEPDRVSRIVSGRITTAEKVGDHAMLQHAGKCKDMLLGITETASANEKSAKGDEHISTPASRPLYSKPSQRLRKRFISWGGADSLKSGQDEVKGPFSISKVLAQWVSQVVVLDDVLEEAPPSLEASINKLAMARNIVYAISTIALGSFFGFTSVHQEVEVRQTEFAPCFLGSRCNIVVQARRVLGRGDPGLKESDASWREFITYGDGSVLLVTEDLLCRLLASIDFEHPAAEVSGLGTRQLNRTEVTVSVAVTWEGSVCNEEVALARFGVHSVDGDILIFMMNMSLIVSILAHQGVDLVEQLLDATNSVLAASYLNRF
ncbi:hypothetical protein HG530_010095 [Fusarium avenaceum]|nr:hypothetical protein HG530_010095 [Fusarium avenaceum]